ncbi:MAG: hypothetical protein AAFZ65_03525 [Planctomycetota bacterium]
MDRSPTHRSRRAAALVALGLLLGACLGPRPGPDDWQQIGFRTPEQTFHTFKTAFATQQYDLEYRCLSEALRSSENLDGIGYRILRDQMAREIPGFSYLSRARVQGRVDLGEGRVGLVARIQVAWIERWFLVELVREEFFELYRDGERLTDGYANFAEDTFLFDDRYPQDRVWAYVELESGLGSPDFELPDGASGLTPIRLSELVVGQEWKLFEVVPLAPEEAAQLLEGATESETGEAKPAT